MTELLQIESMATVVDLIPSRFNARTVASDGTLIVYNSYSGAFTGFPPKAIAGVEHLLHKSGFKGKLEGAAKYLYERGYLVARDTNEFDRFRTLFASQQ